MDIYKTQLLDYYRHPRNRGVLPDPDFASELHNPSCGDSVRIQGRIDEFVVYNLVFEGAGCVISQATASMVTEYAAGKTCHEIEAISKDQILELIGMQLGPTRLKCALLPLEALKQALTPYIVAKKGEGDVRSCPADCSDSTGV